jgi:triosephosphate isomerase
MKKKQLIANWKMNKNFQEILSDILFYESMRDDFSMRNLTFGVCVPQAYLSLPRTFCKNSLTSFYAQNIYWEENGSFTGELSHEMLDDLCIQGSLVGHSERRSLFHETNETCSLKVQALLKNNLKAIYCIGESRQEKEKSQTKDVLREQLFTCLKPIKNDILKNYKNLVIAYEPIWAIGASKSAIADEVSLIHSSIINLLQDILPRDMTDEISVIYGGSVNHENLKTFLSCDNIDGVLVGRASLEREKFQKMICSSR